MKKTTNLRFSAPEEVTSRVTLRNYKKLLNGAGFENHKHLAGPANPIKLFPDGTVSFESLSEAHSALVTQKKEEQFVASHQNAEVLRVGVKKLTEFLEGYKNYPFKIN